MVRNHAVGVTLSREENNDLIQFMEKHGLSNKSDLIRRLLSEAKIIKIQEERDWSCSICNKPLKLETLMTDPETGKLICKYCQAGV